MKTIRIILAVIILGGLGWGGWSYHWKWQSDRALAKDDAAREKFFANLHAETAKKEAEIEKRKAAIAEAVTNKVRERLLAPKTAIFEMIYVNPDKKEQTISGTVNAQNGFGALIEASYTVEVYVHENGTFSVMRPQFLKEMGGIARETERLWKNEESVGFGARGHASANLE